MTSKKNFRWLEDDINNTLVLKVVYKKGQFQTVYGVFEIMDVLETTGEELEVETANIDDLTNLLTLGIVRFYNVSDSSDILDIPLRKLYLLYKYGNALGDNQEERYVSFSELDAFSVIDGTYKNDYLVASSIINEVSDDLSNVMKIAYEFGGYGMQEKFDALSRITIINHRRLTNDEKEKTLK